MPATACLLRLLPCVQRFAQNSLFKRTVLEHIAADLLSMHFSPDPSFHGASGKQRALWEHLMVSCIVLLLCFGCR
jgi:hypothetical protein